jgi:hypothetical protein
MLLIPSKNISDIPNLLGDVRAKRPTHGARDHQFPTRLLDLALVFDDVYGNVQYTKRHAKKKTVREEVLKSSAIAGAPGLLRQHLHDLSTRQRCARVGRGKVRHG